MFAGPPAHRACADCALEVALLHYEELGAELDAAQGSAGALGGGDLAVLVQRSESRPRVLWHLCALLDSSGASVPTTGAAWCRTHAALRLLQELALSPASAAEALAAEPRLPQWLDEACLFEHREDARATAAVRGRASALRAALRGAAPQRGARLASTDALVAGMVRVHRDDASTESGSSGPEQGAHARRHTPANKYTVYVLCYIYSALIIKYPLHLNSNADLHKLPQYFLIHPNYKVTTNEPPPMHRFDRVKEYRNNCTSDTGYLIAAIQRHANDDYDFEDVVTKIRLQKSMLL
ncbi:unnamed protein product [Prorocentrum cordatum]|uniref:Uncharacterized protein n=1 Tax=Prorocentrum cordatum TaxID=2364126 RepID=A0ABN9T9Y2_9DINO|nr:unnamed protein product [Polarella glacialis]